MRDVAALQETDTRTVERFNRNADRTIKDEGHGGTVGGLRIARDFASELATAITAELLCISRARDYSGSRALVRLLMQLPPLTVAYSTLHSLIGSIVDGETLTRTVLALGRAVQAECFAAALLNADAKLARRVELKVRGRGTLEARRQAAVRAAADGDFRTRNWSDKSAAQAGTILLNCAMDALPELFFCEEQLMRTRQNGQTREWTETYPRITPTAEDMAKDAIEQAMRNAPVFVPCREAPAPWTGFTTGGYWGTRDRFRAPFIRTHQKESRAAATNAIRSGSMAQHVSGVNALQAVPWRINGEILSLMQWATEHNIPVKGLPDAAVEVPERFDPAVWEDMTEDAQRFAAWKRGKARRHNMRVATKEIALACDVEYARQLVDAERFYTPMNCDWRGRVYCAPAFNFQRDDRVRALFQFADGVPLGDEDGLYWLKVHVANTGAFDKLDKKPFAERIAWVNKNLERINALSFDPKGSVEWWTAADKPFLFVAACQELSKALSGGTSFMTRVPVSFDGSCSGLQHLSAMTRAPEGALVNLVPMDAPQDVYQTVADKLKLVIERERFSRKEVTFKGFTITEGKLARMAELYGIDRKLVKRQVMTFPYSSKEAGMRDQIIDDTMRKLEDEVIKGTLKRHPFGEDNGRAAAHYLSQRIYKTIAETVSLPAQAMGFLRKCAQALAHEGKVLEWTTPTGLPWINRYMENNAERVRLYLSHKTVQIRLAGETSKVNKDKVANAVSPNFVHACDASHLIRSAIACHAEGVQLATVHDSFGCHAPKASRMNAIIRDEFVTMYEERDVLAEVREATARALSDHSRHPVPDLPQYGSLNLSEIRNARYCFA